MSKIKELESKIRIHERELANHFSNQLYQDICKYKFDLQEIYNKKVEYALFRLGTSFYEEGEKTGKLLAKQLKQRNSLNFIPAIKKDHTVVTDTKEINGVFRKYYEDLHTPEIYPNHEDISDFFDRVDLPKLSSEQAKLLDGPVTEFEIRNAISGMRNGKSPGLDGFPIEYYKEYIDILVPVLKEVYNEAYVFLFLQHLMRP